MPIRSTNSQYPLPPLPIPLRHRSLRCRWSLVVGRWSLGHTLFVVSAGDFEDISFEFITQNITLDFSRHFFVVESTAAHIQRHTTYDTDTPQHRQRSADLNSNSNSIDDRRCSTAAHPAIDTMHRIDTYSLFSSSTSMIFWQPVLG